MSVVRLPDGWPGVDPAGLDRSAGDVSGFFAWLTSPLAPRRVGTARPGHQAERRGLPRGCGDAEERHRGKRGKTTEV